MWFFNSPQIVFGEDALSWLSQINGTRAFIVTDQKIHSLGFVDRVQAQLEIAGIASTVFDQVEPDPCLDTVAQCAQEMTAYGPDWIIALGGGSSMDAAKAAWFLYERPDVELGAINPMEGFGLRAKARLITIPTTSGTGSDVSWGFALADTDERCKLVRVSRELIPDIALVDPFFTLSLPPLVTADTGMDVLAHAIEGYTNTWHNDFTDGLCLKAIQLVFQYLPRAYADPEDRVAREHMHNAATIAGLGFSNTAIILAHALAHAVGGVFHTPHGRTVGLFLPYTIEYISAVEAKRYAEIAKSIDLRCESDLESARQLASAIRDLAERINQPTSLRAMGISEQAFREAIPHMIDHTLSAPEMVSTPRVPYDEDLERLFTSVYEGRKIDF